MAAKQDAPLWLQLVHRFERAIGDPIESAVRSDAYFDLVAQARRAGGRLTSFAESVSEEWLHLLNLPASSDVRKLREQVARMERQLAEMAKELADRDTDGQASGATSAAVPPRSARPRSTRTRRKPAG
jgi:hypothetical protein